MFMNNILHNSFKLLLFGMLILISVDLLGQERTVTGTVTDAGTHETLIGVNITLASDASVGTVTDIDGNYTIVVPESEKALRFSYVGYATQILEISAQVMDVALAPGENLAEVVVVGYGTQKSKEVTSAISSVKSEDFNDGQINDPIQLIQGKVAGLSISRPGGDPNGDFDIRLRGLSTFGGNTQPLIIIDGVQGADLSSVDPSDIASMDVLKDASAAAIYGTKAASGVIIITTKKGQYVEGKSSTQVEFSSNFTTESISRKISVLSPADYRTFSNATDFNSETDWMNENTRNVASQAYNLAVSGATESSSYRVSFNYRQGNGIVLKTGFEQINGRLNFTQRALNDMLTLNFNMSTTTRNEDYAPSEAMSFVARYNPTAPTHASDAFSKEWGGYFQREAFAFYNPLAAIEQSTLDGKKKELIGSLRADLTPVKGLKLSGFYSQDYGNDLYGTYWSKNSFYTPYAVGSHLGYARKETQDRFHQMLELTGEYEKNIDKLNVKVLGGYSWQQNVDDMFSAFGKGFISDGFGYNNLGSGSGELTNDEKAQSYKSERLLIGFFGRVAANYDDAIFLTANFRRDGSSMFGDNNKWGNFGGVSLGVDVTHYISIPHVDRLKVRGGYGVTGNLPSDPYLSKLIFNFTGDNFFYEGNFIPAYGTVRNANPDIKWEVKEETGFGVDFLIASRLSGSIDYYNSTSNDLILNYRVRKPPNFSDYTYLNLGELNNSGLEFSLSYDVIKGSKFTWSTNLNFTKYFDSKILKITSELVDADATIYLGYLNAPFLTGIRSIEVNEGDPVGQIIAPIYTGIDSTGHLTYRDVNGDGDFTANDDYEIVGNGLPDFQLGWGNTFSYDRWFLNFFVRGVFGHSLVNVNNARYGVPVVMGIQSGMQQALDFQDAVDGPVFSDVHVEKADFVKLDNFAFGYTLPFENSKYVNALKLFISGQNLFTITNYSGVDPEVRYTDSGDNNNPLAPGIDRENTYFATRALTFGLNLTF